MKTDKELKEKVETELDSDSRINAAHFSVKVKHCIVALRGHVSSFAEKGVAEKTAIEIDDVRAVADELEVRLPGSATRTDEEIAQACVNAFDANYVGALDEKIKIVASSGYVTAYGHVGWQFQKDAALNAIQRLEGIKGVIDNITIKPRVLSCGAENKKTIGFKPHSLSACRERELSYGCNSVAAATWEEGLSSGNRQ